MYIVGRTGYNGYSDKVYACENNKWTEKASIPYISEYMRGSSYNGNFFCAAVNSKGNVDLLKYDTHEDKWSILRNDFIEKLIYYAFDVLNGYLYVTGGY